jgi:glycosyltransferase involved in cell wall biosynthesis
MRTTVIVGGLPNPTSGGGAVTAYTVISHLIEQGHDLTVCALVDKAVAERPDPATVARIDELGAAGARVVTVGSQAKVPVGGALRDRVARTVHPSLDELFPTTADAPAMAEEVAASSPDAVLVYHWEALAASRLVTAPRLAVVGDPPHLSLWYRWRDVWPSVHALRTLPRVQALARRHPPAMTRMLNECASSGAFAAHHASWLRERGAANCRYFRTPVPDPGPPTPGAAEPQGTIPRILLLGHLQGIVTVDGLRVFARMLPLLDRAYGPNGFEARIVGGLEPPADLRQALDHPAVRFLGHTDDAGAEITAADVFLVPNSISLGIRVRIITAFSYGAAIVSHRANVQGIPELRDDVNALIGDDHEGLAAAVLRLTREPETRARLGAAARDTYQSGFTPATAGGALSEELERLAATPARTAA